MPLFKLVDHFWKLEVNCAAELNWKSEIFFFFAFVTFMYFFFRKKQLETFRQEKHILESFWDLLKIKSNRAHEAADLKFKNMIFLFCLSYFLYGFINDLLSKVNKVSDYTHCIPLLYYMNC